MDHCIIPWTLWRRVRETEASIIITNERAACRGLRLIAWRRGQSSSALETSPTRVQPLTNPSGTPPPASCWGIGWSGPSALKSSIDVS